MRAYLFIALFIALIVGVFIFQNTAVVEVHFLSWDSPEISLALLILLALFSGALLTFLLDSVRYFQIASKIRELTVSNKKLQLELEKLKQQEWDAGEKKIDEH